MGVRYILTDAEAIDGSATLRGSVSAEGAPTVRLFELVNPNLGTYSPTHFVKAASADEIAQRIRENKDRLDQVAIVTDDLASTTAQARNVVMTIERDGVRIQASTDGPTHILLPLQFSHCLVIVNAAAARLSRANLFQTLMSFDRTVDARIEFQFGLFANKHAAAGTDSTTRRSACEKIARSSGQREADNGVGRGHDGEDAGRRCRTLNAARSRH